MGLFNKKASDAYFHPFEEKINRLKQEMNFHENYNKEFHFFKLNISGENCQFNSIVFYREAAKTIVVRSFLPLEIKDVNKLRIAELIPRINLRIHVGSIKLDWEDCKCYVESVHILQQDECDFKTFQRLLRSNLELTAESFVYILNPNYALAFIP